MGRLRKRQRLGQRFRWSICCCGRLLISTSIDMQRSSDHSLDGLKKRPLRFQPPTPSPTKDLAVHHHRHPHPPLPKASSLNPAEACANKQSCRQHLATTLQVLNPDGRVAAYASRGKTPSRRCRGGRPWAATGRHTPSWSTRCPRPHRRPSGDQRRRPGEPRHRCALPLERTADARAAVEPGALEGHAVDDISEATIPRWDRTWRARPVCRVRRARRRCPWSRRRHCCQSWMAAGSSPREDGSSHARSRSRPSSAPLHS